MNVEALTSATTVGLLWTAPLSDGGSAILEYRLWSSVDSIDWVVFEQTIAGLTYTANDLAQGQTYYFKVEALNAIGYSFFSNTVEILAAQPPAQPDAPVTSWQQDNGSPNDANESTIQIAWTAPDNGGSPITGYSVKIRHSDAVTFSEDTTNCDMSADTSLSCQIPVATLTSTYGLTWGDSVFATVIAINVYGSSTESVEGNGAVIITTPDTPTDLTEDDTQRTKSVLAITWSAPTFTGGSALLDYNVFISASGGQYNLLASNVAQQTYTATGLTFGITYSFVVEARTSYGVSLQSAPIDLLCAFIPEPPQTVTTLNENEYVRVDWSEPVANGSPITAYEVYIQESDQATFTKEAVDCVPLLESRTCLI